MSPDFKRLLDAAERAGGPEYQYLFENDKEAIVRAVLTELRETADNVSVAGGLAFEESMFNSGPDELVFDGARKCFVAMVDAILAEPATA